MHARKPPRIEPGQETKPPRRQIEPGQETEIFREKMEAISNPLTALISQTRSMAKINTQVYSSLNYEKKTLKSKC
jgi:hypothetical protein